MKFIPLLFFILFTLGISYTAASSPFDNSDIQNAQVEETAQPGIISKTWFQFMQFQRTITDEITQIMKDMKTGKSYLALLIGLGLAFLYGMVHAIGPGHGKLLVISYFTSHEAKWWRGSLMGIQIAFMHVLSAITLVWLTDTVTRHILGSTPSTEILIIKLISYGAITLIGFCYVFTCI